VAGIAKPALKRERPHVQAIRHRLAMST
jgi:hypothetical protein